jgi:hypothetical protein
MQEKERSENESEWYPLDGFEHDVVILEVTEYITMEEEVLDEN